MNSTPHLKSLLLVVALLLPLLGHAACTQTGAAQTEDDRTAKIHFGRVNLTSTYLQPVGTLLASVAVPPTNYNFNGASAPTVLWICDTSDLPQLYFLVATNGDDRVGGHWETGEADGLPGVYATWFQYAGIKQTMSGVTLSRYWRRVPLTSYATVGNKIHIRLGDIPPLQAELYRISQLPGNSGSYCGGMGAASANGTSYTCTQPNAYIQLVGPGLTHDNIGEDSNSSYRFWGADNGFGYGMRSAATLSNNATCVARNATPLVRFMPISRQELSSGANSRTDFTVEIECHNNVLSGTLTGYTALGIQASTGAYQAAQDLGLVNASGGVSHLVSDNYFGAGMAKGVGIRLRNVNANTAMFFIGNGTGTGNLAGWYPVKSGAIYTGSSATNHSSYLLTFSATLERLPGHTVTAGKVHATAYVLVKVQ